MCPFFNQDHVEQVWLRKIQFPQCLPSNNPIGWCLIELTSSCASSSSPYTAKRGFHPLPHTLTSSRPYLLSIDSKRNSLLFFLSTLPVPILLKYSKAHSPSLSFHFSRSSDWNRDAANVCLNWDESYFNLQKIDFFFNNPFKVVFFFLLRYI